MRKKMQNFRRGPVLHTDELPPNLPPAIDSVSIRENKGSVERVAVLLGIADGQEIDLVPGEKSLVGGGILIHIHPYHHQLRHLALQLVKGGDLLATRSAPARPEIQQNHFATVAA